MQIADYNEVIAEIKDLEIDGLAGPRHAKKKHRVEAKIESLKEELYLLNK